MLEWKYFHKGTLEKSAINHWYKKAKQIFQTKDFITYSKLIINELERCQIRSGYVLIANIKQAFLAVFTAAFCFEHAKHNLIKFKIYNN